MRASSSELLSETSWLTCRKELVKKSMGAAGIGFLFSVRKKSSRLAYSRLSARS
jgi:hypothetical protein